MKNKIFFLFVLAITITAFTFSIGQSSTSVKEQLKKLKGEVEKIVITTDDGEITLDGDDAKDVYKKLNDLYGENSWTFTVSEDEDDEGNVYFIKKETDKDISWITSDSVGVGSKVRLENIDGLSKKIEIKIEDGEKTITVTTEEDGEKKIKTYKGDDTEEYLKKLEDQDKVHIFECKDDCNEDKQVEIILKKMKSKNKNEK